MKTGTAGQQGTADSKLFYMRDRFRKFGFSRPLLSRSSPISAICREKDRDSSRPGGTAKGAKSAYLG